MQPNAQAESQTPAEPEKDERLVKIEALADDLKAACRDLPDNDRKVNAMTFAEHVKLWAAAALEDR